MATAPDTNESALDRRMNLRRGRRGTFAQGAGRSTHSESLRLTDQRDDDEIDHAIDPDNLHNSVLAAHPAVAGSSDEGNNDPRVRLNEVALAGDENYSREYRLTLLHRMMMRGIPLDQIAKSLKVSIRTIIRDKALLKQHLKENARVLNIDEMVGSQSGFYDETAAMALRLASSDATPTPMKLAAIRTALAANADRTRFLNTAGVFDVLRFRKAEDGVDVSDVQLLMQQTEEMFARIQNEPDSDPEPVKPAMKRVRRGGFDKFTMDDADASNSSAETVDL